MSPQHFHVLREYLHEKYRNNINVYTLGTHVKSYIALLKFYVNLNITIYRVMKLMKFGVI